MRNQLIWQDIAIRILLILSGIVAATIFVMQGKIEIVAALAAGGTLGAFAVRAAEPEQ